VLRFLYSKPDQFGDCSSVTHCTGTVSPSGRPVREYPWQLPNVRKSELLLLRRWREVLEHLCQGLVHRLLILLKIIAQRVFGTSGPHECLVLNVSHVYDQFTNGNRLQARRV